MVPTIILVFITIVFLVTTYRHYLQRKKYLQEKYLINLEQAKNFIAHIRQFNDYITWVERDRIKSKYASVGQFFKNRTNFYKKEETVKKFNEIFQDFDNYIVQYNKNYVSAQKEKLKLFFDNIEEKKLDDQQRTAVITDEYSNLIIAGAGSGKTLTILGKVQYLIEQKNIKPDEILLLSFTQKTVAELNERLQKLNLGVQATTFHKLGYDTIKKFHNDIPAVTNKNT